MRRSRDRDMAVSNRQSTIGNKGNYTTEDASIGLQPSSEIERCA